MTRWRLRRRFLRRPFRDLLLGGPAARDVGLRKEQRRRREAEAIAEVAKSLTTGLDFNAVAQRVADHARDLLGAMAAAVYRVEPPAGDLVAVAVSGPMGPAFAVGSRLRAGAGVVGFAAAHRRAVSTTNVLDDPRLTVPVDARAWIEQAPHRAVLGVPLIVKNEVVGVLSTADRLGRTFAPEDVRLAEALADHAALALANARLFADAERRRREAETLARVAADLTERVDVQSVAERVVEVVMPLFQARAAGVRLTQADGSLLGVGFAGLMKDWFPPRHVAPAGSMVSGRAVVLGRPVASSDVFADARIVVPDDVREGMAALGDGAVLAVPLRVKDATIGALSIADRPGRVFTTHETELLQAFADEAAVAVERARLHAQTELRRMESERATRRATLLSEASRALTSSLDLDTTLDTLTRVIVPDLADWCTVHLLDGPHDIRRVATAAADPERAVLATEIERLDPEQRIGSLDQELVRGLVAGESVLVPEITADWVSRAIGDPAYRALIERLGPRSLIAAPLRARGRVVGSITFVRTRPTDSYDAADLALAEDLASRAGFAIDNAQLFRQREQAQLAAEHANRSKDEFLAVLSHELRTPLTSILGWVRILRIGRPDPVRLATALEVIERNSRAQAQLINDLLDVSRIVAGKLQLDRYPVDLAPLVMQAVDSLAGEADAKGVRLPRAVDEASAHVLGDPTRIQQVLTNLISNAIKFTPAGGAVTVRLERALGSAQIVVTDTGVGIAPDLLPYVFDRFRQADSTITRAHGGLGLGLAIVKHLVELHGGRAWAESAGVGQGAIFVVELPLVEVAAGTTAGPLERGAEARGLAGLRALVVEDDADARDLVRVILEERGAAVTTVSSVTEAMARLTDVGPQIVLSDLGLPDSDGYELLRQIRAAGVAGQTVPVIALTAYAGADDRARALAAGFTAHIAKPVDPDVLVRSITETLDQAAAS